MNGGDYREGLAVGERLILGRAFPGGLGPSRRYRLRCGRCGEESTMTHGAIGKLLKKIKDGLTTAPCPACDGKVVPVRGGRPMRWGRRAEDLWRPGRTDLPPGTVSPALAWPVPGREARP